MTTPTEHARPHPLITYPVGAAPAPGKLLVQGDLYLAGWSLRETTGAAAAQCDLIDGNDGGGVMVATVSLNPGESIRDTVGGHLLVIRTGLYLAVNVGTVTGAVWVADRVGAPGHRRAAGHE